ncbi:MAG TPA: hypothetical protein PK537_01570 [Candidatus Limiplasma sp.]|nr:hypothetical protein [Candidatus Limiplasma sp.]
MEYEKPYISEIIPGGTTARPGLFPARRMALQRGISVRYAKLRQKISCTADGLRAGVARLAAGQKDRFQAGFAVLRVMHSDVFL